jgi:hypothetical protein
MATVGLLHSGHPIHMAGQLGLAHSVCHGLLQVFAWYNSQLTT